MHGDRSVWYRSFDPNVLLDLSTENLKKLANESPKSVSSFRASDEYLSSFYDALEESLEQLPPSFDTQDSYKYYELQKKLLTYVRKYRSSKISLNNFSHLQYLLPWDLQPISHPNNTYKDDILKNILKTEISQAKLQSRLMNQHYSARYTGQTSLNHKKGLFWTFLSESYRDKTSVEILVYVKKLIKYTGRIMLFDLHCNILLDIEVDNRWVYIKGSCICYMKKA